MDATVAIRCGSCTGSILSNAMAWRQLENPYWRNKILRHFPYRLYYWYWQRFPQPQARRTLTPH